MTAIPVITFDAPVNIYPNSEVTADEIVLLEVFDTPPQQQLSVVLRYNTNPVINDRLLLYNGVEYEDLVDWTYESLCARIKSYYENGRSFPHYVSPNAVDPTLNQPEELPSPEEDPAPTGE